MRLITFTRTGSSHPEIGARLPNPSGDQILPFADVAKKLGITDFPVDMKSFLRAGNKVMEQAKSWVASSGDYSSLLISSNAITYLPPITNAEKFLCVGKNYRTHLEELKRTNLIKEIPQEPTSFIKLNSCLSGHEAKVVRPKGITRLDYEPELVFVIGKRALGAKKAEAMDYVAGYVLHNDVSERAFQLERGGTWDKGKGCDTFAPLGPWLVTKDEIKDPHNLRLWLSLNGKMMQDGNTDDLIFNIPQLISYTSQFMTLLPGDVISTGTPAGVGLGFTPNIYLKPGDVAELGIDGLGISKQNVIAYQSK
jgi:5-carboxymethyl-2-hydroxymuconate isomerase/acylpyruvate hydrolase